MREKPLEQLAARMMLDIADRLFNQREIH
jgi:hypothetical protein